MRRGLVPVGACVLALLNPDLRAQSSDTPADALPPDTIQLSPFTVSTEKDKGYRATNSVAGTRLSTEIKKVPMSIEVITNDFIRDTGSTSLRESLRYSSGIILSSQQDGLVNPGALDNGANAGANDPRGVNRDPNDTTLKIRGFVVDQVLRDGFRRQTASDSVNIERIEVVRGPSALLYGVGSFGGVVNYLPKEPQLDPSYDIEFGVGSWDFKRASLDFTGPLGAPDNRWKAAYRVTAAAQENGDGTDFYERQSWFVSPVFSFQPFENTRIKLDIEAGESKQRGIGFQNVRSRTGSQAQQRRSNFITTVLGADVDPRTFRWSGADTYMDIPAQNFALTIEQKLFDDLILRVGAQTSRTKHDSLNIPNASLQPGRNTFNGTRPTDAARLAALGSPTAIPISLPGDDMGVDRDGQPLFVEQGVLRYQWTQVNQEEDRDQLRAELNYQFNFFGEHRLLAGYQYQGQNQENHDYTPRAAGDGRDRFSFKNPTDFTPIRFGVQGDGVADVDLVPNSWNKTLTWDSGYYGIYQGRFWDDRITLIGGVRHDRADQRAFRRNHQADGSLVVTDRSATRDDPPSATSPQYGATFALTREISVFGLHSEALVPQYFIRDGLGRPFDPTSAENNEFGVKFDLFNGRVSGTIGVFKIERKGTPRYIWWAPSPVTGLPYNPSLPRALRVGGSPTSADFVATYESQPWWNEVVGSYNLAASPILVNTDTEAGKTFMRAAFDWAQNHPLDFPAGWMFGGNGTTGTFGDGTPGMVNSPGVNAGTNVAIDDESSGWDTQWIISPTDNWQIVASYSHIKTKITSGYQYVKVPIDDEFAMWKFPWVGWGTVVGIPASEAFEDPTDSSTYKGIGTGVGQSLDDTPEHTASLWTKYTFEHDALKGWGVGLGGTYMSRRPYVTGFTIDGTAIHIPGDDGHPEPLKLYTDKQFTASLMLEYQTRIGRYDTRFALNVDNLFDDTKLYGYLYAPGRSFRFTVRTSF